MDPVLILFGLVATTPNDAHANRVAAMSGLGSKAELAWRLNVCLHPEPTDRSIKRQIRTTTWVASRQFPKGYPERRPRPLPHARVTGGPGRDPSVATKT